MKASDSTISVPRSTLCAMLVALALTMLGSCHEQTRPGADAPQKRAAAPLPATQRVSINHMKFDLELALTPPKRYRGLSDRSTISDTGGMLFVFPEPEEVSFVMRRCLVPIDILFITADGEVAAMYEMAVEPYDADEGTLRSYPSHRPVQFVIELKGGTLAKLGIRRGDKVDLPYADLKRRAE